MNDDAMLLRRFVEERSEGALAALVRRHVDLVYSAALRRSHGDGACAAEIARQVFWQLAREAAGLSAAVTLPGWLHAETRNAASQLAVVQSHRFGRPDPGRTDQTAGAPAVESDWGKLEPILDDTIDLLPETDRVAVLLRWFDRRSFADLGAALNLSAVSAQIRTERAFDKFRALLAKRGLSPSAAALSAVLTGRAVVAAPDGLAAEIAAWGVAGLEPAGKGTVIGHALLAGLNSTVALGVAAGLIAAGALGWGYRTNRALQVELARLRGENQELAALERDNRRLARGVAEAEKLRRELAELPALRAAVTTPAARPAAGVVAVTVTPQGALRWEKEEIPLAEFAGRLRDFRGKFPAPDSLVVVHGMGAPLAVIASVLDEARKAEITRFIVDGDGKPDNRPGDWF